MSLLSTKRGDRGEREGDFMDRFIFRKVSQNLQTN